MAYEAESVGPPPKSGAMPAPAAEGSDPDHEAKLDASDRAIAASEAGDRAGFMDAMTDFVRICMRKYS
jgi:hypothetical protein